MRELGLKPDGISAVGTREGNPSLLETLNIMGVKRAWPESSSVWLMPSKLRGPWDEEAQELIDSVEQEITQG